MYVLNTLRHTCQKRKRIVWNILKGVSRYVELNLKKKSGLSLKFFFLTHQPFHRFNTSNYHWNNKSLVIIKNQWVRIYSSQKDRVSDSWLAELICKMETQCRSPTTSIIRNFTPPWPGSGQKFLKSFPKWYFDILGFFLNIQFGNYTGSPTMENF